MPRAAAKTLPPAKPAARLGQFGPYGPAFEVLREFTGENGQKMARVRVLESGEVADLPALEVEKGLY